MGKRTEIRWRDWSWTDHQERLVSMDYAKTIAFFFNLAAAAGQPGQSRIRVKKDGII